MLPFRLAAALAALVLPTAAFAHTGFHADGLADGALHPLTGADHLLAMVGVGLWAASLGGIARYALPVAFVSLMAVGAALGLEGIAMPGVEHWIAASVVGLGVAVAFQVRVPTPLAALLVAVFALAHGQAHAAEMPAMASPLAYALGFGLVTAALHGAGLGLGTALSGTRLPRIAGGLTALAGLVFAFGS
ncbi:HupE/UreJ family protein [uncultured Alsobacter sp.]|uniref:HupE/UreJ family protein n=1 Tax=uncultured Alsobacter sp. TaxID=1748258 RepID=UPI0025E54A89|nr:HupE/UreJ family protein [uncultured Alsobacter sp.]